MHWCAGIQAETGVNVISDCDPMARFPFLPWHENRVPEVDPSRHPPILGEWREGQSDVETAVGMVPWCTRPLVFKQNQMTCGGSQNMTSCQDFNPCHGIMT